MALPSRFAVKEAAWWLLLSQRDPGLENARVHWITTTAAVENWALVKVRLILRS